MKQKKKTRQTGIIKKSMENIPNNPQKLNVNVEMVFIIIPKNKLLAHNPIPVN